MTHWSFLRLQHLNVTVQYSHWCPQNLGHKGIHSSKLGMSQQLHRNLAFFIQSEWLMVKMHELFTQVRADMRTLCGVNESGCPQHG